MTSPHFGILLLTNGPDLSTDTEVVHKVIEQIRHADSLGFEEAWVAEHNGRNYGIISSAQFMLAAAASVTSQIRLGSGVTRLPMHLPLLLAEDYAYLDQLSLGRLNWGIGKAYDPLEFQAYGIPMEERDERGLGLQQFSYQEYIDDRAVLLGSPDKVAEELADHHRLTGIGGLLGWFDAGSQPQEQVLNSMQLFAEKVRPQL